MASVMKVHTNQLYYEFFNVDNIIPIDIHQMLNVYGDQPLDMITVFQHE